MIALGYFLYMAAMASERSISLYPSMDTFTSCEGGGSVGAGVAVGVGGMVIMGVGVGVTIGVGVGEGVYVIVGVGVGEFVGSSMCTFHK